MIIIITIIISLSILAFFIYASASIGSGVYLNAILRGDRTANKLYLSFDDGPNSEYTPIILDILKENNIKAIFFRIGKNAQNNIKIVERIVKEGHLIGNHSFCHSPTFPVMSKKKLLEDISSCNTILEKLQGSKVLFFRPPFGVTNPNIAYAVKQLKLITIGWSIRSFDTCGNNIPKILKRIEKKMKAGGIILLHDNLPWSSQLLLGLIDLAKNNNYSFDSIKNIVKV